MILRSFIAIELAETTRSLLSDLQQGFTRCGADVRWVKPANIHLTLSFLGEIAEKDINNIEKTSVVVCSRYDAFRLEISGAGVFPNKGNPRVLWVGVDGKDALTGLQREIEEGMSSLGFKAEKRRFIPHITLGRFRSSRGTGPLLKEIQLCKSNKFGSMEVGSVCLIRSDPGPAGVHYTRMAEFYLSPV